MGWVSRAASTLSAYVWAHAVCCFLDGTLVAGLLRGLLAPVTPGYSPRQEGATQLRNGFRVAPLSAPAIPRLCSCSSQAPPPSFCSLSLPFIRLTYPTVLFFGVCVHSAIEPPAEGTP